MTFEAVHKFGGSGLTCPESFRHAAKLVKQHGQAMVVLSATQGTTQALLDCLILAEAGRDFSPVLEQLRTQHQNLFNGMQASSSSLNQLNDDFNKLGALLLSIQLLKEYSATQHDWLLSHGEYWSSQLFASYLAKDTSCQWLDASLIIALKEGEIDWEKSQKNLSLALSNNARQYYVFPGFVGSNSAGKRCLLGFNGSDYSAAILAKLSQATQLIKWTNVSGVYSADPKKVRSCFPIAKLNYQEAAELAYFGANVLHPKAVAPVYECQIPIHIKNISHPDAPGTLISNHTDTDIVCGLSSIESVALINIEGNGLVGVCGVAARVFDALRLEKVSVILISQASSEHSISLVVTHNDAPKAHRILTKTFEHEIGQNLIDNLSIKRDCAIIAAIGEGMVGKAGVAKRFFASLADANINIHAIAQGSSERNISIVIDKEDCARALRALHGGFYLARRTLSVGLIGPGGVGKVFLEQLSAQLSILRETLNLNLRLRGLMNSKTMVLSNSGLSLEDWQQSLEDSQQKACPITFAKHIGSIDFPHAILIDCTASQQIANHTVEFLEHGCHVITPNKKANSGSMAFYHAIQEASLRMHRHYLYETTVCAGLPVIKTLRDLISTGDTVTKIEGIVSGTLSYIFNQVGDGMSFAQSVLKAYELGYTEPDPRDDLSGLDVARKFICLGRELGLHITLDDVELLNLIPEALSQLSVPEFLKKLPEFDEQLTSDMNKGLNANEKLSYVGEIEQGRIRVSLKAYNTTHPFAHTQGTDNILSFTSARYKDQPLVIQGPGAGLEVTAAGVFAELIHLTAIIAS